MQIRACLFHTGVSLGLQLDDRPTSEFRNRIRLPIVQPSTLAARNTSMMYCSVLLLISKVLKVAMVTVAALDTPETLSGADERDFLEHRLSFGGGNKERRDPLAELRHRGFDGGAPSPSVIPK